MKLQLLHSMNTPSVRKMWCTTAANSQPFFQHDYLSYVWKQVKYFSLYSPRLACVTSDQGEPLMLLPLRWNWVKRCYKMLSDIQGCGQADALFNSQLTEEEKMKCVAFFYNNIHEQCRFKRLPDNSALLKAVQGARVERQSQVCVKIDFPQGAEPLLASLSKSVRQNLRTAYNRMNRDSITYRLQVYRGEEMTNEVWQQMMAVYLGRLFTKYKMKAQDNYWYRYTHYWKYRHIKHDTKSLRRLPNSFHAVLYGNGHLMGFMSGFISYDGTRTVIPRLAIDNQYRFYSPGYVLLAEILRWLDTNTQCRCLDLSRGDEQYKLDLGGVKYHTGTIVHKP